MAENTARGLEEGEQQMRAKRRLVRKTMEEVLKCLEDREVVVDDQEEDEGGEKKKTGIQKRRKESLFSFLE